MSGELDDFADFCARLTLDIGGPMALEPFQREFLGGYFEGARETVVLMPKKNGKTTLIAALALYHCIFGPSHAECVVAAASRDQAGILLRQAKGFIDRSGLLRRYLVQKDREIHTFNRQSRIRILAADADTADGVLPTLAIVDELHRQHSADLYGVFRDGLGPRDGRMVTISTAGEHETSPLGQMRASARRLKDRTRDGAHLHARSPDGAFVFHEWALTKGDDLADDDVVKRANPASWQTPELLRERRESPSMLPSQWARFACGLWVSIRGWWLDPEQWKAAEVDDRLAPGDRVALGFDGARTGDATGLVACRLDDGLLQPLAAWEDPGDGQPWEVDGGEVDAAVADAFERYRVVRAAFDPPLWQTEIDGWATEYGSAVVRYPTKRGRMVDAVERFRTDLAAGRLKHTGDATLTRHALNAQMRETRVGYWLAKPGSGPADKIDLGVAAVLAYEARADALASAPEPGVLLAF